MPRACDEIVEHIAFDAEHRWESFGKQIEHDFFVELTNSRVGCLAGSHACLWMLCHQLLSQSCPFHVIAIDPDPVLFSGFLDSL